MGLYLRFISQHRSGTIPHALNQRCYRVTEMVWLAYNLLYLVLYTQCEHVSWIYIPCLQSGDPSDPQMDPLFRGIMYLVIALEMTLPLTAHVQSQMPQNDMSGLAHVLRAQAAFLVGAGVIFVSIVATGVVYLMLCLHSFQASFKYMDWDDFYSETALAIPLILPVAVLCFVMWEPLEIIAAKSYHGPDSFLTHVAAPLLCCELDDETDYEQLEGESKVPSYAPPPAAESSISTFSPLVLSATLAAEHRFEPAATELLIPSELALIVPQHVLPNAISAAKRRNT